MPNSVLPEWADGYIRVWRDRLGISQWRLLIDVADTIDGDPDIRGLCEAQSTIRSARLTFRADMDDTFEWRRTIIHELLHVAHADIDYDVECVLFPAMKKARRTMARAVYQRVYEQYTDNLADMLARMDRLIPNEETSA